MRLILTLLFFTIIYMNVTAQSTADKKALRAAEGTLKTYAFDIVNADELIDRLRADSFFTRSLVQSLKIPYS